jgi:hypothetical protein
MLRKKQKGLSFPHVFSGNPEELDFFRMAMQSTVGADCL